MDLISISFSLAFLSMLKSLSLGVSFRVFIHILYSFLYIREKTGLGRTAHNLRSMHGTPMLVGISSICCFGSKPLLTSNLCAWPLLSIEAETFKVQSISTFKSFFLKKSSWFRKITCLASASLFIYSQEVVFVLLSASCLIWWNTCVHLCHQF